MESIAESIGMSRTNLTKTINGNHTVGTLNKIASALGVDLVDLFNMKKEDFTAFIPYSVNMYRFDDTRCLLKFLEKIKTI